MSASAIADPIANRRDAAYLMPPAQPRTHLQLARSMTLPDGPRKGDLWPIQNEPVQVIWCRQCDNPRWNKRTRIAPSQRGKTMEAIILPVLRTLIELKQNACYIMPNLDKLNQAWVGKLVPLVDGCGFGAWLPKKGPASRGGRPAAITLIDPVSGDRAGTWYFMAASNGGKETSLASVTGYLAATDEGDDFQSAGQLKLGEKRGASFGEEGQSVVASTVNDRKGREGHPALDHYQLGSRTRVWFQCPTCAGTGTTAGYQLLTWARVRGADGTSIASAREAVRYSCEHCDAMWTEADRKRALVNCREVHDGQTVDGAGRVTGPEPEGRHYSLLSTDLDYAMSSLESMAEDWWVANDAIKTRGDHSLMRVFYNKRLCEDYQENAGNVPELEEALILNSSATACYNRGDLPPTCKRSMIGVDVQLRRHYWLSVGFEDDGQWYICDWGRDAICGDLEQPTKEQRENGLGRLDDLVRNGCRLAETGTVIQSRATCDTGYRPEEIRPWIAAHRGRWIACKGAGEELASRMVRAPVGERAFYEQGWYDVRKQKESPDGQQMFVDADAILDRIAADWVNGRGHVPKDIDRELLRHLVGMKPGKVKRWEPRGDRHDFLDCLIYAIALDRLLMPKGPQRTAGAIKKIGV